MAKTKRLKVLSIDFDYFQNVLKETVQLCYPDGIDLPTELSTIVWSGYYANPKTNKLLNDVTCNIDELNILKHILKNNCLSTAPIVVANSHVHIYEFIHQQMQSFNAETCSIVNIDMHHDLFNDNPKIDCGNWLSHISDEIENCHISWIANKISKDTYGLNDIPDDLIKTSLNEIINCKFDIVFLCRSDNWLPPHLDTYFTELVNFIQQKFINIYAEKDITKPRDYMKLVNKQKQIYEQYMIQK